jgi:hypothetical protein
VISIKSNNQLFVMKWAKLGFAMAILGIIEFAVSILRFKNWGLFSALGILINIVNQLILFPVWLIWLGRQLPKAEAARCGEKDENAAITENSDSALT